MTDRRIDWGGKMVDGWAERYERMGQGNGIRKRTSEQQLIEVRLGKTTIITSKDKKAGWGGIHCSSRLTKSTLTQQKPQRSNGSCSFSLSLSESDQSSLPPSDIGSSLAPAVSLMVVGDKARADNRRCPRLHFN